MKFNNMILIKTILLQVLFTFATAEDTVTELVSPTISLAPSAAPTIGCDAGGSSCADKDGCRRQRKMQEELCSSPSSSPSVSSTISLVPSAAPTIGCDAGGSSCADKDGCRRKRKMQEELCSSPSPSSSPSSHPIMNDTVGVPVSGQKAPKKKRNVKNTKMPKKKKTKVPKAKKTRDPKKKTKKKANKITIDTNTTEVPDRN